MTCLEHTAGEWQSPVIALVCCIKPILIIFIEWLLYAKLGISALYAHVNEPPNNLVCTVDLEKLSHLPVTNSHNQYWNPFLTPKPMLLTLMLFV